MSAGPGLTCYSSYPTLGLEKLSDAGQMPGGRKELEFESQVISCHPMAFLRGKPVG